MDFFETIKTRKSIRSFDTRTVDKKSVEQILDAATHAPTNCNQQLWNFIVITEQKTKERLIKEAATNTLVRRAPVVIVVTYDGWNRKEALQGASLAVGHMILAAHAIGLGTLPMNSYGADSKVHRILNIPTNQTICCFVLLGYPDERANTTPSVTRRPARDATHWELFHPKDTPSYDYHPDQWTLGHLRTHQTYYSRKTFPGKEMDIMNERERGLVTKILAKQSEPFLDIGSYDGAYLREFPTGRLTTIDLTKETSIYTKAAAMLTIPTRADSISYEIYDETSPSFGKHSYKTATILFKWERLPRSMQAHLLEQIHASLEPGGELVIIGRKQNIFLSAFFGFIRLFFGNDIRKTGIFAFFGPYRPLSVTSTRRMARKAGFSSSTWHGYFFIPALCAQLYQMALQYRKSEGSSYLHRETRDTFLSRSIARILALQGFLRCGIFGSVAVIICKK